MIGLDSLWDPRGDLRPEQVRQVLKASKLGSDRDRIQVQVSWLLA